jgi:hypothetical protein
MTNRKSKAKNKLHNVAICPVHKIPMSSLVNAYKDDVYADKLNVETFACMQNNCTKQAVTYGGDIDLYLKVREHYGIK